MFIGDVSEFDPYQTISTIPKSKHQLPTFISSKVESHLEAFYKMFAHYANTGINAALANTFTLGGMAKHNFDIHHHFFAPMENMLLGMKTFASLAL
jgi:hypothetical protein